MPADPPLSPCRTAADTSVVVVARRVPDDISATFLEMINRNLTHGCRLAESPREKSDKYN